MLRLRTWIAGSALVGLCRIFSRGLSLGAEIPFVSHTADHPASSGDRAIAKTGAWNQIVRKPNRQRRHQYLLPRAKYHELFDWDTYFMGVALTYHHRGRSLEGPVEDLPHFTDHYFSFVGYTPREVDGHHMWAVPEMCKPFLAKMALRVSLTMHHVAWLKPYYHRLADTIRYWRNARRATDGLLTWFDGIERRIKFRYLGIERDGLGRWVVNCKAWIRVISGDIS